MPADSLAAVTVTFCATDDATPTAWRCWATTGTSRAPADHQLSALLAAEAKSVLAERSCAAPVSVTPLLIELSAPSDSLIPWFTWERAMSAPTAAGMDRTMASPSTPRAHQRS